MSSGGVNGRVGGDFRGSGWCSRRRRNRGGRKEKARKERRLLSTAVPSPLTKTVTPRSSSSAKRVRAVPRQNLPDSSDESEGGIVEAMRRALRERHAREVEEAE
jgi:hypothetical protein